MREKLKDSPKEQHQGHDEGSEVIVLVDGALSLLIQRQIPKQLHTQTVEEGCEANTKRKSSLLFILMF